jgi:outer membrane protein TolC
MNFALLNQPQQKVTAFRLESSQKLVNAARGAMYPTLTASGSLNTNSPIMYTIIEVKLY